MATRKRKPAKRKTTRRGGKRRRRGLGDVFQDRVREAVSRLDRPTPAKVRSIKQATKQRLCEEGEYRYCSGKKRKRGEDIEAAFANFVEPEAKVTPAAVAASNAAAEAKGCVDKKGMLCVDKKIAFTTGGKRKGKKAKTHLRKGCHAVRGVPGAFRCSKKALKRISAGTKFFNRLTGEMKKVAHRPLKGHVIVAPKVAKKKDGGLKKGCQRRKGHFECTKTAAKFYLATSKRRKKK